MAALDRCATGVLAVAYEPGRCAVARTAVMRDRVRCAAGRVGRYVRAYPMRHRACPPLLGRCPLQCRMHSPPGAGCGDWQSLIAMTLPYRGSLTLFPFDSEEELAKNVDFWRLMLCAWGFIAINCRENSREGSP